MTSTLESPPRPPRPHRRPGGPGRDHRLRLRRPRHGDQAATRGEHDFVVLERADDVGGTWRDNTYPGAACDVQSKLYSFSFAPNPDWPRSFSPQPEIQAYLQVTADRSGVLDHFVFGADVTAARWDDDAQRWLRDDDGRRAPRPGPRLGRRRAVRPDLPRHPGHRLLRRQGLPLGALGPRPRPTGKRVAVIGTGASAIQIVPAIQPIVDSSTSTSARRPGSSPAPTTR